MIVAWRKQWYVLCGGILFYCVNIGLTLQFVQFGAYLMADRYLYVAGAGIIFPVVYYLVSWFQKNGKQWIGVCLFSAASVVLVTVTFLRNDIWLSELNFYNAILDEFPNSAVAQYSLGALYLKEGNYSEAEIYINQAVQTDPHNYKALYDQGVLYMREGKVNDALEALNKCIAVNPYPKAYFSRAMLYMGTGKPDLALADAEKVLAVQPENARAWYVKANCLFVLGNTVAAIECDSKAIQYENNEPLFYTLRGQAYAKTNQPAEALKDLNNAVALNPSNGKAYYLLGIVKYQFGQSACGDLNTAIAKGFKVPGDILEKACNTTGTR
jgi:tetratricopeptide (TPR) repeat protein